MPPSTDATEQIVANHQARRGLPRHRAISSRSGGTGKKEDSAKEKTPRAVLVRLRDDSGLRAELAERGRQRAAQFSHAIIAQKTLAFWQQVLNEG